MKDANDPSAAAPLEQMLESAFAVELDRLTDPAVAERVLERIRRQARLRLLTLATVSALGLWVLLAIGLPAVSALPGLAALPELVVGRFGELLPASDTLPTSTFALVLLLLLTPWLWAAVDDTV